MPLSARRYPAWPCHRVPAEAECLTWSWPRRRPLRQSVLDLTVVGTDMLPPVLPARDMHRLPSPFVDPVKGSHSEAVWWNCMDRWARLAEA